MWKRFGILLLFAVTSALPVRAWDETGHKVTAYIAWQHMTPEARAAVSDFLSYATPPSSLLALRPAGGESAGMIHFVRSSVWPDLVRDRDAAERYARYDRETWHYTNIFWEETPGGVQIRDDFPPTERNIVERLRALEHLARMEIVPGAQQAVFIAWLAHLVGDIHQPLHVSARVTEGEPEGDRGGNLFELAGNDNLHSYWDRALSDAFERQVDESEFTYIRRIASSIMGMHAAPTAVEFDYDAWAQRSFQIASRDAYDQIERGEEPPVEYAEMVHSTASESIALAGYRLAELMNSIFG